MPRPGAANALGELHAIDGIVGTISQPQLYAPPLMSYAPPQVRTSSTYNYPSANPPQVNPYTCPIMPYAYPHLHQIKLGPTVSSPFYPNVSPSPSY